MSKIKIEEGTYAHIRYTGWEEKIKVSNRNVRNAISKAKSLGIVKARGCYIISLSFYDEVKSEMPYCHKGTQRVLRDHYIFNESRRIYYPDAYLLTSAQVEKLGSWVFRETKIKGEKSVLELPYSPDPACRPLLICSNPSVYKGYISVGKEAHMCPSAFSGRRSGLL